MTISSATINSAGLVLDIIGALLLIKFGIPNDIDPKGQSHLIGAKIDQEEIKLAKQYKRWSNFAIGLIIAGFALQLISNWVG